MRRRPLHHQRRDVTAVDRLRDIEDRAAQGLQHYDPFNRDGCRRKQGGNEEKWMRRTELLLDVSVARAAFEIPKLARIKVAPPPPEEVTMEIRIFDSDGKIEELRRERDRRPRAARERRGADPDDMVADWVQIYVRTFRCTHCDAKRLIFRVLATVLQ